MNDKPQKEKKNWKFPRIPKKISLIIRILLIFYAIYTIVAGLFISSSGFIGGNDPETGSLVIVLGVILLIAALLGFRRLKVIMMTLSKVFKYFWATWLRRVGFIFAITALVAVIVLVNWQAQYKETLSILHFDGNTWNSISCGISGSSLEADDIWGSSSSDIYVLVNSMSQCEIVLHYDGHKWSSIHEGDELGTRLLSVWGSSPTDVFIAGTPTYHTQDTYTITGVPGIT